MGWVTPLGTDVDAVWARLLKGDNAIAPVTRYDASTFATNFAAEVQGFSLADFIEDAAAHSHAVIGSQFALAAAAQAWRQAGLGDAGGRKFRAKPLASLDLDRVGMYLGAGEGSLDYDNFLATNLAGWKSETRSIDDVAWAKTALRRMSSVGEIEQEPNIVLSHLSQQFGCKGPAFNCMTACAASTQAIGEATEIIKRGDADVMLAGGTHSMIHLLGMTGFIRLTAMSTLRDQIQTAARPFSASRDGFVMGEGAGVLILEDAEHATRRGAKILAEIAGYGSSADAFRITDIQPDGKGAVAAMSQACRQAGISPRERVNGRPGVQYISAHGTGTQENDRIETIAVKALFGDLAKQVPFSSVKSMLGHLIQAAGAVELMTCVKAIETGFVPPTMNLTDPDADLDLDYVPNAARDTRPQGGVDVCLSNSFGFGGQNNTICVRRWRA